MRVIVDKNKSKGALNLTVKVIGFTNEGDQVGVKGVNVFTKQEVTVWLTTKGKSFNNPKRKSIAELQKGFNISRTPYILKPGGLVSFKSAFPKIKGSSDQFFSNWANVLAYNEEEKKYLIYSNCAIVSIHSHYGWFDDSIPQAEKETPWGRMATYETDPEQHIVSQTPQGLHKGIIAFVEQNSQTTFIIRLLDLNGRVLGHTSFWKTYCTEEKRNYTPAELAAALIANIENELQGYGSVCSFNVVPGKKYAVSPTQLRNTNPKESALNYWVETATSFYSKTEYESQTVYDYYCKEIFAKLGGPNNEFVNNIQFINPDKNAVGIDPVLAGDLQYSQALGADKAEKIETPPDEKQEEQQQSEPMNADQKQPEQQDTSVPDETLGDSMASPGALEEPGTTEANPENQEEDAWASLDSASPPQEGGLPDDLFSSEQF